VNYAHERFNLPLPGFLHVACPHFYRGGAPDESEEQYADRLVGDIEALIAREGAETIAAFFVEPIMAAGGVVVPPRSYFAKLQALLRAHNILLICDEVVTAFARTGNMFGSTTMELVPDMLICAKALSGAYVPIAALLINAQVFDAMARQSDEVGVFGLTMTYSGHPVAAAVAREAIRIYEDDDMVGHVRAMEPHFIGGLQGLRTHPLVGEVRGYGLLAGVELVEDKATHRPFAPERRVAATCAEIAERHGLLVRAIGDTIALCPPLIITDNEVAMLLERLTAALDETAKSVGV
jgi:4-aminobutyrate--pyruvate transaminase